MIGLLLDQSGEAMMAEKPSDELVTKGKDWASVKERERPEDVEVVNDIPEPDDFIDKNASKDKAISELETANQSLKEKVDEYKDIMIRSKAEVENMRKRTQAEVQRARQFGQESMVKALLPVVDSMDQALASIDPNDDQHAGMKMTHDLLKKVLKDFAVEVVGEVGQPFDASLHEAMSVQESDKVDSDHIIQVLRPGFTLHGRVVRAAMVIVAK